MQVRQILEEKERERGIVSIGPDATIFDVIQRLNERRIGALMVVGEDEEILGIVTERDVMWRCLTSPHPDLKVRVREVMTSELVVGKLDDDVQYVMGVMIERRIRHLPILDEGQLVGMLSIGDVVKCQLVRAQHEARFLVDYINRPG